MLDIKKQTFYKGFGMNIISDIPLPELQPIRKCINGQLDVEIINNNFLECGNNLTISPYKHVVIDGNVNFFIPNVGHFSVIEGKKIVVTPESCVDEGLIRLYILGSCMGALLMQRHILPLHGSGVVINGKVYAIVGESGAGKSTLAAALINQGYKMVSDDIIAISVCEFSGIPLVIPGYPQQKLWQKSIDQLGIDSSNLLPIYQKETKFSVPVVSEFSNEILPLGGVFELVKGMSKQVEVYPIEKLSKLHTLFFHTYRNFLIPRLELMDWHFQMTAKMVNNIKLYQLSRPDHGFSTPQLISQILSIIKENENDC